MRYQKATPVRKHNRVGEGDKTYCTRHGKAHLNSTGGCPGCNRKTEKEFYENIVFDSNKPGLRGINAVISEHVVGTRKELAARRAALYKEHHVRRA